MGKQKRITKRSDDYSDWYHDVIAAAELADYAPVRGSMVIRPYGFAIWENLRNALDRRIKETGHQNAYFPLFIPQNFMNKEAEHVEGFAPECAVVTHGGGKELEEPLFVRPTSEAIIYHMYARWVQSWRDLPVKINQWANVVRWEMRTRLFLRTLEFLWQEGHTAHETFEEAQEETMLALSMYKDVAENVMGMPVLTGQKTDAEKFAGAEATYAIEAMMQDGKALQAGTSHNLGQNFAKAFDLTFQVRDPDGDDQTDYAYNTSWGVSTRLVGGLIMTHSDDQGLVLPPALAPHQFVIVPIWFNDEQKEKILKKGRELADRIRQQADTSHPHHKDLFRNGKITVHFDERDYVRSGEKRFYWEKKGVPVRLELGPRDLENGQVIVSKRTNPDPKTGKTPYSFDRIVEDAPTILAEIQEKLYKRARTFREEHSHQVESYDAMKEIVTGEGGFVTVPWAGTTEDEERIQNETKATIRVLRDDMDPPEGKTCIVTEKPAKHWAVFAQSY